MKTVLWRKEMNKRTVKDFSQMTTSKERHFLKAHVFSFNEKQCYIVYSYGGSEYIAYITAYSHLLHENEEMTVEEFSKFNYSNYCAEITVNREELKTIRFYNEFEAKQ